jgi:hypothetical protein
MDIDYIDKWFMCMPDILLKLDTAPLHSLHSRRFLDSSFFRKERFAYSNISMATFILNRLLQALCSYNNII